MVVLRSALIRRMRSRIGLAHHHVQTDRGLVEEEDLGLVQERGGDLASDPLPQGEPADRGPQIRTDLEGLREKGDAALGLLAVQVVDVPEETQRVEGRQVKPELRLLPEHGADPIGQPPPVAMWIHAQDGEVPRRGVEDARDALDGGGLPGAVRADESQKLAPPDLEGDVVHRAHGAASRREEAAQGAGRTAAVLGFGAGSEDLREMSNGKDCFHDTFYRRTRRGATREPCRPAALRAAPPCRGFPAALPSTLTKSTKTHLAFSSKS